MKTPFHIIIVGMTACGKTHYLLNMLERDYKGHFDYIFIVPKVFELPCVHDDVERTIREIVNFVKNTNSLIVLDDCASSKDVKKERANS